MSQGRPASHHAPRRSRSPLDNDQVSPSSTRYGRSGSGDIRQNIVGVPHTNGDSRTPLVAPRTLGVHNILNPPEPHRLASGAINHPQTTRAPEAEILTSTPGPLPAARAFVTGQPASISLPGTPVGTLTPLGGPGSERNSPTSTFPFPAMNNPRKKLSPKPPRSMSLSHGQASHGTDHRQTPSLPSMAPTKRPYEREGNEEHRSQLPRLHHSLAMPPGPVTGVPPSTRALTQPIVQSPGPHGPPSNLAPTSMPGRHQPQPMPAQAPLPPSMPPSRSYTPAPPVSEGGSPWSEIMRRHGLGGGMAGGEAQQAYMTLPGSDTPIPVQVDYSQASKKADEKRQRNAVASTRHRRKKKIMLEENTKQLQELRDERRQLEIKMEEIAQQRDWYRDERRRLREIVAQTPGISHLAGRPQSPASIRSGSFAERSPLMGGPQSHMPSPQISLSELPSGERPAQRRRTDDRPEFSMPVFGTPVGGHPNVSPSPLPPLQAPAYGVPSRPTSATSSSGGDRLPLPPLRAMENHPPPPAGPGQVQEQDPRTGQWVTVQPRAPDAGWATRRHEGPR
ncbi:hypothetical protein BGZ63DRAFT_411054 [Mariannaea sp. PMI_226]|nr:hypothetical protein BGZ63DRAFT_411054 [Mariannaea sp. PMI_226]